MSLIPAFDVDVWNAWILIAPYLLVNFVLPLFAVGRKSTFWVFPSYTKLEKVYLITQQVLMGFLLIFSIFLPLNIGTAWFFVGLPVYLFGLIFVTNAMLTFILNPVDKPNTTGLYHISRHPMYLGILLVHIGIGIATASYASASTGCFYCFDLQTNPKKKK